MAVVLSGAARRLSAIVERVGHMDVEPWSLSITGTAASFLVTRLDAFDDRKARALQMILEANERILDQEVRVETLRNEGHPTARSEVLLRLMRHSRALMEQTDLLFRNQSSSE